MLSLKYPQFNLGLYVFPVVYKYNTTIAIRMDRVSEDCPKTYSCCGEGINLLNNGFLNAMLLHLLDEIFLNFIDNLYVLFIRKIKAFNSLSSYDSNSDFEDYINHYIYLFLLGRILALNEIHFSSGEQR